MKWLKLFLGVLFLASALSIGCSDDKATQLEAGDDPPPEKGHEEGFEEMMKEMEGKPE